MDLRRQRFSAKLLEMAVDAHGLSASFVYHLLKELRVRKSTRAKAFKSIAELVENCFGVVGMHCKSDLVGSGVVVCVGKNCGANKIISSVDAAGSYFSQILS
jgi:hypothetical protein